MKKNSEKFIQGLKEENLSLVEQVEKSDLHSHAERGASKNYFEKLYKVKIPDPIIFKSITEMDEWYDTNISEYTKGFKGMVNKYISLFKTAQEQNIKVFSPAFCLSKLRYFDNNTGEYIKFIKTIQKQYAPDTEFYPELQLRREMNIEDAEKKFLEAAKYDFFKSIDLMGDEKIGTSKFKELYKEAHKLGWILKAHVGEFADVSYMYKAIDDLNLDAINHGLAAIQSDDLMKYLADSRTMVNICPTSNVLLSRVHSYKEHPIRSFVDSGILCSLNTDDLLIFNQTVSQEYLNLYNNGVLGAEELNQIRVDGLTKCLTKKRKI